MIALGFTLVAIALALHIISVWLYMEYRTTNITTHLRNSVKLDRYANGAAILAFIVFCLKFLLK